MPEISRTWNTVADNPDYSFVKGDICDAAAVEAAMRGCDAVVHFAAESHVDRSIYEPAPVIETNVTGTFILLQVARKLRVSNVSCTSPPTKSTATWSPARSPTRIRRFDPAAPIRRPKPVPTCWCVPMCARTAFPAMITRSSNNYGPYQFPEKFLPLMITNALDDKPLPIYGDGKQQRDWLHVEDNCRGVLAVLERGRVGEVYNIGGVDIEENLTIARRLLRLIGKPESLLPMSRIVPATIAATHCIAKRWNRNWAGSRRFPLTKACADDRLVQIQP